MLTPKNQVGPRPRSSRARPLLAVGVGHNRWLRLMLSAGTSPQDVARCVPPRLNTGRSPLLSVMIASTPHDDRVVLRPRHHPHADVARHCDAPLSTIGTHPSLTRSCAVGAVAQSIRQPVSTRGHISQSPTSRSVPVPDRQWPWLAHPIHPSDRCWHGTRGASGMELPDAASGPRHRTRARAVGSLEKLDDRPVLKCQLHD